MGAFYMATWVAAAATYTIGFRWLDVKHRCIFGAVLAFEWALLAFMFSVGAIA